MAESPASSILGTITSLLACHDLPQTLPASPMTLLLEWFEEARARGGYADFNAMTLATATPDGRPSARIVLCKSIDREPDSLTFFTNYQSRKGGELEHNAWTAAVFHWPHASRQVRIEGRAQRVTDAESDAYFKTRALVSRIGASVSKQSQVLPSREALVQAAMSKAAEAVTHGGLPRPANWGGFRISFESVELWSAREGRLHDRARWVREGPGWRAERLYP